MRHFLQHHPIIFKIALISGTYVLAVAAIGYALYRGSSTDHEEDL